MLIVPLIDKRRGAELESRLSDLDDIVGQVVGQIEIGGDGIAHLHSVNDGILQLQRTVGRHLAVGIGEIGGAGDHRVRSFQGGGVQKLLRSRQRNFIQLQRALERRAGEVGVVDRAAISGQLQGLRAAARQVRRQIERERLARRVVLQRHVNVVVDRARLVLLIIGDGDLAVGDLQLAEGELPPARRGGCAGGCLAGCCGWRRRSPRLQACGALPAVEKFHTPWALRINSILAASSPGFHFNIPAEQGKQFDADIQFADLRERHIAVEAGIVADDDILDLDPEGKTPRDSWPSCTGRLSRFCNSA